MLTRPGATSEEALTDLQYENAIVRALRRPCKRKGCGAARGHWCRTKSGYATLHANRKDPRDR
jgi:hypothetical protein